ncbi:ABC transporter ATP-binding protein [Actinophytocola sp.]|uniref:ABC transporter ATP-binding protein n=1 Tax=Actinophytocola sp. TaxID=1872138 RepID=UPI00389B2CFC
MAVVALVPIAVAMTTGLLIGSIPDAVEGGASSEAGRQMLVLLATVSALVLAQHITTPVLTALGETLGREVDRHLQEQVMSAVGRPSGIAHLTDQKVLAALRTVRGLGMYDNDRPSLAVIAMVTVLPAWLRAVAAAAVLLWFHWWLGLLWLAAWPLVVYFMQREYFRVGQLGFARSTGLQRSEYLRDLAITGQAAKEVRVWGLLDWLIDRYTRTWHDAMAPVWRERSPRARVVFGTAGTIAVLNLISFGLLVVAAVNQDIDLAALAVFMQALTLANSYTAFDDQNAYLAFAAAAVPRVRDLDTQLGSGQDAGNLATLPERFPAEHITLSGVQFRYPGTQQDALREVDLTVEAGRSLAIVGENGAGKSSLVKILCGLYAPTAGTVVVDGQDLAGVDPAAWRARIGVLFQDFAKYHLTVADNIGMGAPRHAGDQDRLRDAADRAGALPLIDRLPHGWDTVLSPEYSGGVDLSGGQWQRIALARTLFAVDAGARVLILDEPTAALDVRAEAEIYERFLELTAGLTTILISHRFSTVRCADRIVVLDQGVITEDGAHDELIALDGQYARMFALQAARFVEPQADRDLTDVEAGHA